MRDEKCKLQSKTRLQRGTTFHTFVNNINTKTISISSFTCRSEAVDCRLSPLWGGGGGPASG